MLVQQRTYVEILIICTVKKYFIPFPLNYIHIQNYTHIKYIQISIIVVFDRKLSPYSRIFNEMAIQDFVYRRICNCTKVQFTVWSIY